MLAACGSSSTTPGPTTTDSGATVYTSSTPADDAATATDVTAPDVTTPDTRPTCLGAPDCPCTANADCNNALCIDTPAGKHCARPCERVWFNAMRVTGVARTLTDSLAASVRGP